MKGTATVSHHQSLDSQKIGDPTKIGRRRIQRIRPVLLMLPWLGLALQGLLAHTAADWMASFLAASGAFIIFYDAFRPQRLFCYPLSILIVLGYGVTMNLGPLLFTALEGNSITTNLVLPLSTFGHAVLCSLIFLLAHASYRHYQGLHKIRQFVHLGLFRLGLFNSLRLFDIAAMGILGVFALSFTTWFSNLSSSALVITKLIQGLQFLSIVPFAFMIRRLWANEGGSLPISLNIRLILFVTFTLLIALVGTGRNSRGVIFMPLTCIFLGFILEWLYGLIKIRLSTIVAFGLAIMLLLPLLTDLSTAMVMVRGQRKDISAAELVGETLNQFQDRDAISRFRLLMSEIDISSDWSEYYVSNPFLARFTNAKFPDNSLVNTASLLPSDRAEMASFHWLRFLSILPGPFLSLVGVSEAIKLDVNSISFGDKIYFLASGNKTALGGFRGGHFFGTGMSAFGFGYLLILFMGLLFLFPLVDAHSFIVTAGFISSPRISVVAITQLKTWFALIAESTVAILNLSMRRFIEPVLLFALVRWLLSKVRLA